jgi:hypothetical protein
MALPGAKVPMVEPEVVQRVHHLGEHGLGSLPNASFDIASTGLPLPRAEKM